VVQKSVSRSAIIKGVGLTAASAAIGIPAFIPQMGSAADTIKIGLLEPATGTYAVQGELETRGYRMAAEAWNKRGGIMGRQIELISEDEQSDPGIGVQKARKLVNQDKCVALGGTISSGVSISVSAAAASLGVIFMDSGGHSDDVTGSKCSWSTFRTCHSTWMETHATGSTLAKKFGKKWYLITPDYAFGHALEAGYKDVLQKLGGTIVGNDLTPLGTTDFSSYLTKVEAAKPDVLIVLVQGNDAINCLKQINQFGLNKKVAIGGAQLELENVWSLPPEARVGFWGVEYYFNSELVLGKSKAAHQFVADYMKAHKQPPTARPVFGYISGDRLFNAMAEAKSTEAVKVAKALEGTKFETIVEGTMYYRKEDHQLMWPMWTAEVRANGTSKDKLDIFNVIGREEPEAIEQSIAEKAKVCTIKYP